MENTDVLALIKNAALDSTFPDNTPYISISHEAVGQISTASKLSCREIEIAALNHHIIPQRYARNMKAFSLQDQARLLQSTAAVIGLGGLGGTVIELLARTGIGRLILMDGDVFEETNLNRQLLSSPSVMGQSKTQTALVHINRINPSVEIKTYNEYLTENNCRSLLEGADVVVDCLDNLKTRFLVEQSTKRMGVPLVFGAVGGHTGQVMTIFPEDKGLEKIYGDPTALPEKGIETTLGTLSPVVFMVASAQSAEVAKVLLNRNSILRNKLLLMDPFDAIFDVLEI